MINMSNEQKKEFFQNWHDQWIKPELNRRFGETGIPENFVIRECLVTFPKGQVPIVQFDGEFGWHIQNPKLVGCKTPGDFGIGQPIHIYDILSIDSVLPPMIDGERVSFMYLYWDGFAYHLYVDFVPNQPEYDPNNEIFKFDGSVIALHLQNMLVERVVQWAKLHQPKLQQIGMWTATPLILYPLSRIVERIDKGKLEEARQILVDYCDAEFISTKLVQTWHPIKAYKERQRIFDDALFLHRNQRYHGSINTLVGQIEGVIVDWLHEVIPPSDVKWKTQSRIDQFRDALHAIPQLEYAYKEALESTIEFLKEGEHAAKPFQAFKSWLDKVDPDFPARHALAHGKYVPEIYTEENSIKMFLLLDTICQFMMFYEVRVLGRNLGQQDEENT